MRRSILILQLGNKGHNAAYTFYDNHPIKGLNYYQLKITPSSGAITFSNVTIGRNGDACVGIIVEPIPSSSANRDYHIQ